MTGATTDLTWATVRELGRRLRAGETTPTELARRCLERLDRVARPYNAVVTLTPERALREARLAEAELAAGHDRGPLHGIPYGAKDLLATANIPTSWGAAPYRDQVFPTDAAVIERLHGAGAVLVAKLAMIELAGGMGYRTADASFSGPALNAWDREAFSGGSSSGSAVAVALGAVPFAIGSETSGSIVAPAAYCGVSGLRPTYGRVSRRGAMALSWTMDKLGPICRTADDCGLVLAAIAGPDPEDPTASARPYRYEPTRLEGTWRIGVVSGALDEAEPEVAASFERSLALLRDLGQVDDVALPEYPYVEVGRTILQAEGASAFEELIASGRLTELQAPEDRTGGYSAAAISAVDYLRAQRIRGRICRDLDRLLERYDALVLPTSPNVAPSLDEVPRLAARRRRRPIGSAVNVAGLPGISIPNGVGRLGRPTALELVGRAWSENRILGLANALQERTDWHARHPDE